MMEMSQEQPVEEAPAPAPVEEAPAPVEATPAPAEAPITAIPEPMATSNGVDAQVSVDVPAAPAPEPPAAPGWHDMAEQVRDMRLKLTALEDVQSRLEQMARQNESLQEQLALHQAAANTSAADVLKQVAALVAPFA